MIKFSVTILHFVSFFTQTTNPFSWQLLVKIRGKDVNVELKKGKHGDFLSTIQVDGETKTMSIEDNFSLVNFSLSLVFRN